MLNLNLDGVLSRGPQPTPLIGPHQLPKRLLTSFFTGLGCSQDSHLIWALRGRLPLYFSPCQAPVMGTNLAPLHRTVNEQ